MKKTNFILMVVLIFLFLGSAGCKGKEKKEIPIPQKLWRTYNTEDVIVYAADGEGNLYALERESRDWTFDMLREDADKILNEKNWFCRYDSEGNRVFSVEEPSEITQYAKGMVYREGKVYFATQIKSVTAVCSIDTDTGELEGVIELPEIKQVRRVAVSGECLYLLGSGAEGMATAETGMVFEYSFVTGKLAELGMEGIIDIAPTGEGSVLLYGEQDGEFAFLIYDAARGAVRTLAKTKEKTALRIAKGPVPDSFVFLGRQGSIGYALFSEPDNVAEVYPAAKLDDACFSCVGKTIVLADGGWTTQPVCVDLTGITPKKRSIRYISGTASGDDPYGCGFTITRSKLENDMLVLKLLAQDTDFDMTYVNSWSMSMTGVRDSGCFYPLNDVPGVMEYLDRCFPYVKDAVTDENGDIWMLPVRVDMDVMVCDTKRCRERGYAFFENMDYGEFLTAMASLSEEEKKQTGTYTLAKSFMTAYFYDHKSVDTPEFRQTMRQLQQIKPLLGGGGSWLDKEYIFKVTGRDNSMNEEDALNYFGQDGRAYNLPKLEKDAPNIATCQGFVINPKSDNLEQALQYVATWVAYQMNDTREIPPFFAVPENRTDSFLGSLYRVYENGAITMGVSEDLYVGYHDVIAGKRDLEEYIRETEKKLKIYFGE